MARFSKERLDSFDDFDDVMNAKLTPAERKAAAREAENEIAALHAMRESLSRAVAAFMAEEGIGIVELTRLLDTSSRQTNRVVKAEANVTLATLAHMAAVMGKRPRIVFDDVPVVRRKKTKSARA